MTRILPGFKITRFRGRILLYSFCLVSICESCITCIVYLLDIYNKIGAHHNLKYPSLDKTSRFNRTLNTSHAAIGSMTPGVWNVGEYSTFENDLFD